MKRFLDSKACGVQQVAHCMVMIGVLVTVSACSTGGGSGYYADNTIQTQTARDGEKTAIISAGETAVVNEVRAGKVKSPDFLTNDPYTALSPDEMIRLYSQ